mmetsp:Transcript_10424/g.22881  ORF Transcript_10424/g.22881 Transcript_10424/m.22881 type:complete len:246 (-) Transcript_10424:40-777(-)
MGMRDHTARSYPSLSWPSKSFGRLHDVVQPLNHETACAKNRSQTYGLLRWSLHVPATARVSWKLDCPPSNRMTVAAILECRPRTTGPPHTGMSCVSGTPGRQLLFPNPHHTSVLQEWRSPSLPRIPCQALEATHFLLPACRLLAPPPAWAPSAPPCPPGVSVVQQNRAQISRDDPQDSNTHAFSGASGGRALHHGSADTSEMIARGRRLSPLPGTQDSQNHASAVGAWQPNETPSRILGIGVQRM